MIDPVRRESIIVLLVTRDDHLPQPIRREHSPTGFIHNTPVRETCPDCFGDNPGKVGCQTCKSRGYLEYVRERDPYAVTDKVQPYGMTGDRHERTRERDREIMRLDDQLAPPKTEADMLEEANTRPEGWELERARKWRDFDYRALDLALEDLRAVDVEAYHAITSTYVYGRGKDAA